MKRFLSCIFRIIPHLCLILALMMLTFFTIDLFNPSMAFLNNTLTKYLLALFSLLSLIPALYMILKEEKGQKTERK